MLPQQRKNSDGPNPKVRPLSVYTCRATETHVRFTTRHYWNRPRMEAFPIFLPPREILLRACDRRSLAIFVLFATGAGSRTMFSEMWLMETIFYFSSVNLGLLKVCILTFYIWYSVSEQSFSYESMK